MENVKKILKLDLALLISILCTLCGVAYYQASVDAKQTEAIENTNRTLQQITEYLVLSQRNAERIRALERTVYGHKRQPEE